MLLGGVIFLVGNTYIKKKRKYPIKNISKKKYKV